MTLGVTTGFEMDDDDRGGLSACPSKDFSEASSLFINNHTSNWQFEEEGEEEDTVEDDFMTFPASENFFKNETATSPLRRSATQQQTVDGQRRSQTKNNHNNNNNNTSIMLLVDKVSASKRSGGGGGGGGEDTCSTQITDHEEDGCYTLSLASNSELGESSSPTTVQAKDEDEEGVKPKEYEDCFSGGPVEKPMMMVPLVPPVSLQQNGDGDDDDDDDNVDKRQSSSARDAMELPSYVLDDSSPVRATEEKEDHERTSSLAIATDETDSPAVEDATAVIAIHNNNNNNNHNNDTMVVGEIGAADSKVRYSKAAQEVLKEEAPVSFSSSTDKDLDENASKTAILLSLQSQSHAAAMEFQVSAANATKNVAGDVQLAKDTIGCDDALENICNGLADSTLYGCHVFMSLFDNDDSADEYDEQEMIEAQQSMDKGEIMIPEEAPMMQLMEEMNEAHQRLMIEGAIDENIPQEVIIEQEQEQQHMTLGEIIAIPQQEEHMLIMALEEDDPIVPRVVRKGHVLSDMFKEKEEDQGKHQRQQNNALPPTTVSARKLIASWPPKKQ
ncbi:unnamed protein product [Cylindrotheca closterium]|uniref:Uncharacterized protein n=1 Tax=Cylindrotheca closterium TaxID=2856 RepID=A0AAD2JJP2_9STRA|nr:unnamed protein product [Cylindrotheca closterium]